MTEGPAISADGTLTIQTPLDSSAERYTPPTMTFGICSRSGAADLRSTWPARVEGDQTQRCVLLLEAGLHLVANRCGGRHAVPVAIAHQMMIDELTHIVIAVDDSPLQNCPSDQKSAPQA